MISPTLFEEIKKRYITTYNPLEIYLFGSYAWGQPHEESDLDFLIILEQLDPKERYHMMANGHRALLDFKKISEDILVLSKNEFEEASQDPKLLYYIIKKKGKKIYARA
ncbi:hypothetical protein BH09DEP1_BH09DEP1_7390 [soil metagenome]